MRNKKTGFIVHACDVSNTFESLYWARWWVAHSVRLCSLESEDVGREVVSPLHALRLTDVIDVRTCDYGGEFVAPLHHRVCTVFVQIRAVFGDRASDNGDEYPAHTPDT